MEFPARNSGPLPESRTIARDKELSEKSWGPEILEFPAPRNSALTEFPAPYQRVAPRPFGKDLAKFSRAKNYEISGPRNSARPEFLASLQNIAPQHFVRDLAEFRRARNYAISGPQKFCSGAEITALGQKFRP
jgi:hypothetical protein